MELSDKGLAFLIECEGSVTSMYNDNAGHCTVGVGHLIHKGNCDYPSYKGKPGFTEEVPYLKQLAGQTTSDLSAEKPYFQPIASEAVLALLKQDKSSFEDTITSRVTVALTQSQFDALVSFAFNIGVSSFADSTLLKLLNTKKYDKVSAEMKRWINSTKDGVKSVNPGLVNRRDKEADLFDDGTY